MQPDAKVTRCLLMYLLVAWTTSSLSRSDTVWWRLNRAYMAPFLREVWCLNGHKWAFDVFYDCPPPSKIKAHTCSDCIWPHTPSPLQTLRFGSGGGNVHISTCFIYTAGGGRGGGEGTKIDGLRLFSVGHEFFRENKHGGYRAAAHLIYMQPFNAHGPVLFKVP